MINAEIGIFFGLPGTYMNNRSIGIVQIDIKKQITLVAVSGRKIILLHLYPVHFAAFSRFFDVDTGKFKVDKFLTFKASFQITHIRGFAQAGLFDLGRNIAVFDGACLPYDPADNNQGIFRKNGLQIIEPFQGISRLVGFDKVDNGHAGIFAPLFALQHITGYIFAYGKRQRAYFPAFRFDVEHHVFDKRSAIAEREAHGQRTRQYAIVETDKFVFRRSANNGFPIVDKFLINIVTFCCKAVPRRFVLPGVDGVLHFLQQGQIRCAVDCQNGFGGVDVAGRQ